MSGREIKIVVVGGSWGGIKAIKQLLGIAHGEYPNLRITLVEKREQYFHQAGAIRGVIDPEYSKRLFVPYDRVFSDDGLMSPKHCTISGSLAQVHSSFIVLENGENIEFDYLILATGAQYPSLPIIQATTYEEAQYLFQSMRASIKKAENIVIVGGGGVGVGVCGEIADAYPEKHITLIHSNQKVLNAAVDESFSDAVEQRLRKLGVELVENEQVLPDSSSTSSFSISSEPLMLSTRSGASYKCDMVIWSTGSVPETSFMNTLVPSDPAHHPLINKRTGEISVRSTLQLDDPAYPHIFAIGDVNSLPRNEKYAHKARAQAKVAVNNIRLMMEQGYDSRVRLSMAAGEDALVDAGLVNYIGPKSKVAIPIGKRRGVFEGWFFRFGDFAIRSKKGRDYMIDKAVKLLNY